MAEGGASLAALDKDKLLVSDSTSPSFTGIVTAHNELVTTCGETRQLAVTVEQDLAGTKKGIEETTTKHEERMTGLEAKLEETKRQLEESLKAHEESLKASEERWNTAFKAHEEANDTKVKHLELQVEDAFAKIQTSNLSQLRMRAELDTELEKVRESLEKRSAASAADLARVKSELTAEQTMRLNEAKSTFVARRDFEDLLAKFNNSDAKLATLTKYSEGVEGRRLALEKDTKEKLEALWSRAQTFVKGESRKTHQEATETLGKSLEQLELVVKRMDYERLAFEGKARQDIDALVRDTTTGLKAAEQATKSQAAKLAEDFQGMLNQGIVGVQSSFNSRVAKMEETYLSLKGQVAQVSTSATRTQGELESAKRTLTETAKTEAGKVLTIVNKDGDSRFNELAMSLKTMSIKHHGLAEQVARDLAATRQMVSTSFDEVGKRYETIAAAENRTEPLKQAVHALVQELEEVTHEQKRTDDAVNLVSVQLNDFEDKITSGGFYIGPVAPLETKQSSPRFSRPSSAYGRKKGKWPMNVTAPSASTGSTTGSTAGVYRPGQQHGQHHGPPHPGPGPHHGPWLPTSPRPGTAREGVYAPPGPTTSTSASTVRTTFEEDFRTSGAVGGSLGGSLPRFR
mmetsp:Transcript_67252/g.197413  ORF Transcript_67252/g.197413 Transcript_67252/m.197413 type:complete len:630 (-) Transcript_67252:98-1987(-)